MENVARCELQSSPAQTLSRSAVIWITTASDMSPNYYWTAEMRCCMEYLRSLALCEWGKSWPRSRDSTMRSTPTMQTLGVLSSKDTGV